MGYASWYNDYQDYPVLQIIWPDKNSRFPWNNEFNKNFKFEQPLLDRNTDFKFLEEHDLGVFTTEDVLDGAPILYVYHDQDGDWQFHSEKEPNKENGITVSLESLVKKDPTLNNIYYLNYGESAVRDSIQDEWEVI